MQRPLSESGGGASAHHDFLRDLRRPPHPDAGNARAPRACTSLDRFNHRMSSISPAACSAPRTTVADFEWNNSSIGRTGNDATNLWRTASEVAALRRVEALRTTYLEYSVVGAEPFVSLQRPSRNRCDPRRQENGLRCWRRSPPRNGPASPRSRALRTHAFPRLRA